MDYDDPRAGFTGRVSARVLSTSELEAAAKTFSTYRKYMAYPGGYESRLVSALSRGQNPASYAVKVLTT